MFFFFFFAYNQSLCHVHQAKHDVKDKNQLLSLIKKYPAGIAAVDLKDAYPNVMDDLQVHPFCFLKPRQLLLMIVLLC